MPYQRILISADDPGIVRNSFDCPERHLDSLACHCSGIVFHRWQRGNATNPSRADPLRLELALALHWYVGLYLCPHRALDAVAIRTRSLADGGDVCVRNRDIPELFSCSDAV